MTDQADDIDRLREALGYFRQLCEELSATTLQQDHALATLRHQLDQKRRSFSVLAELQQFIHLHTPLSDILGTTVASINQTLAMDKTLVLEPTDQKDRFRLLCCHGFDAGAHQQLTGMDIWLPWRKTSDRPHLLVNSSTSSTPFIASIRSAFDLPYFVCLPIQTQEEFIGLLVAGRLVKDYPYHNRLSEEDVNALKAIVGLITAAVRDQEIAALKAENERKEVELQKAAELEEAYQELEDTNRKLEAAQTRLKEQAEKLHEVDEQKSRFFANISHEFRTPLTLIISPLEDALDGRYDPLPETLHQVHQSMLSSARRLLRLADQLLDLSKIEHGATELRRRQEDLISFVQETVRRFAPMAERRDIMLRFTAGAESLSAPFDAEKVEKVVANLLSNALKFTPRQGKVWVTVRESAGGDQPSAEIVVKDTGSGIPADDLEHIFDRFRQAGDETGRRQGAGIGLTLSRQLTKLHGGRLLVESEEGFGSTFTVRLPLEVPEEELAPAGRVDKLNRSETLQEETFPLAEVGSTEEAPAPTSEAETSPAEDETLRKEERVALLLVVEDNADVRAHLRTHLESEYQMVAAEDGVEGLALAREHRPDLVIVDVMMPEMDGYELIEALKADDRLETIPIVMLTARADTQDAVEALERGADDFLTKPFHMKELHARVEALLRTRRKLRRRYSKEVAVSPSDVVISSDQAPFARQVVETVEAHLSDSTFGTSRLADALDLSRRHLTRRVKEAIGETPGELLRRMRLERAAQLLRETSKDVSEIARAVGFTSPSHFSKSFQAHFGASPTEFVENET